MARSTKTLAALPGGTETILIVDDDDTVRALLGETLKMKGYRVLDARFNSAALLIAGRHDGPIHLMVADLMMPGVTGRELARRLEALRPEMKLLYISGYPKEAVFGEKLLEEEAEFLEKPISPEGLLTKIRQLLDSDVEEPDGSTDFVAVCLNDVLNKRESYGLSPEQVAQLQLLAGDYERNRLLYDAEFMVAEMHVQTLIQDDASALSDIELALQKSERAQTLLRLEGVKTLRAAEALLRPDQRRRLLASYPHGRKRAPDRLQLDKKTVQ